jgi:predicted N-acetyltransferase YhbS
MIDKSLLFNFLDESFSGMKRNMERCETIGFPWASRTFLEQENGNILSHVGFLEYPMLIEDRMHKLGAIHAVCTKETHRGRGLSTDLIKRVLAWAKQSHEAVVLYTGIPAFYERIGFKKIQEYRFKLQLNHPKGLKNSAELISPRDDALFKRLYSEAAPASKVAWVKDDGTIASFNTLFATFPTYWSLHYCESIEAIVSWNLEGKTLHVFDIVSKHIPSLKTLLDYVPGDIETIYFYFSPDLLAPEAISEPHLYDEGHLMVHGTWPDTRKFMIAPLSRC